jgi:acetyl esterase/lipase
MIHGGGWRSGNKSLNTQMARALAGRGFVVLSVEYRLSLEAKYPAALLDVFAALNWLHENAGVYNVDTSRIALAGYSAGGQMASLIGVGQGRSEFMHAIGLTTPTDKVKAVVDLDGLLDFTDAESLALERTSGSADVFWLNGFYDEIPHRWREASAITWVDQNSPPFLFINSSQTRFHAGCARMTARLAELGIYAEVHKLDNAPHSFWFFHPWFEPMINYIDNFLKKVFDLQR